MNKVDIVQSMDTGEFEFVGITFGFPDTREYLGKLVTNDKGELRFKAYVDKSFTYKQMEMLQYALSEFVASRQ